MRFCLICFLLFLISCGESVNTSVNAKESDDTDLMGQVFNGVVHIPTGVAYRESGESCWIQIVEKTKEQVLIKSSFFEGELTLNLYIPDNGRPWHQRDAGENQVYILRILRPQNTNEPGLTLTLSSKDSSGLPVYTPNSNKFIKQCFL